MMRSKARRLFLINPPLENSVTKGKNRDDTVGSSHTSCDREGQESRVLMEQPSTSYARDTSEWGPEEPSTFVSHQDLVNDNAFKPSGRDLCIEPGATDSESEQDMDVLLSRGKTDGSEESSSEMSCELLEATSACRNTMKRSCEDESSSIAKRCAITQGAAKQNEESNQPCQEEVVAKPKGRSTTSSKMGNTQDGLAENSDQKIPAAIIRRNGHTIQGSVKTKSERKLRGILQRIEDIVNQLNWTYAFTQERHLETLKKKKAELQVQIPSLKHSVQNVVNNINIITGTLSCIEIRLKDLRVGKSSTIIYDEARQQYFHSKRVYHLKLSEIQILDNRILLQEPLVEKFKGHLEKLKKEEETYMAELASKELICKELSTAYDEMSSTFSAVHALELKYKSELAEAITAVKVATERIPIYEQQIAVLQGHSYLSQDEIAHIAQEIETALRNSKFKKTPLGPIEQYVAVRDEEWLNAVSTYLNDILQCFCVDNSDDNKVLQSIFVKILGTRPKPTTIVSEYHSSRHDVTEHEVRPPQGMCSMLDMLTIENHVIVNCLIDQMEVERMLLVPTNEEAHQLMSNADAVPINIKAAITRRGTKFYPLNVRDTSRANNYDAIQENENELEFWEQYKLTSEQEVTQLTKAILEKSAEVAKIVAEKMSAGKALVDAEANVREYKNFNTPIPWKHAEAAYHEELAILDSFKSSKEELVTECHIAVDALIEAKKVVTALRETAHLIGDKDSFLFDRKMLRNQLRVLKTKKKRFSILLSNVQSEIVSVTGSILLQQQVSDQANRLIRRGYRYRHPKRNSKDKKVEKLLEEKKALEEIILKLKKQQH